MHINKAEYIKGAVEPSQYPSSGLPEMIFAGRSNVGKSSFINSLTNRKQLARVSSRPGKTQTLNFYNINDAIYLVDVPGYGYAKVNKTLRESFGRMIERYLMERDELILGVLLVDFRHKPTADDIAMYELYKYYEIPTIVIGTKKDKVGRTQFAKQEKLIKATLEFSGDDVFIPYSSETHDGRDEVLGIISDLMEQYHEIVSENAPG
ncbi:MAG: ribosome biogenesis GTP-binding protein YihA/YsxC [Turicibacter sp.]|nr:ribosome biogenesis GTP-binding protein YihA/YsxC [Turicibacter sp.]